MCPEVAQRCVLRAGTDSALRGEADIFIWTASSLDRAQQIIEASGVWHGKGALKCLRYMLAVETGGYPGPRG